MSNRVVINGRFLLRRVSGVERYGQEILRQFEEPVKVIIPSKNMGGFSGHLWEQSGLPLIIRKGETLWSPANSGPLVLENQVLTLHDISVIEHPEWFSSIYSNWYRMLLPKLVHKVKKVITVSDFSKERILAVLHLPEDKVKVVLGGVDTTEFFHSPDEETMHFRECYKIQGEYLLTVGSIGRRKNLPRLLEAWERLSTRYPDLSLVICGGSFPIFRAAEFGELPKGVRYLDYVEERDLRAIYTSALAFVLPSLYEGFGLTILEAMACGTPVLASNAGALPEVLGSAGVLFDPLDVDAIVDALQRVIGDDGLRQDLRLKGYERVNQYSWKRTAQQVGEILNDAML